MRKYFLLLIIILFSFIAFSCGESKGLGSEDKPFRIMFIPSGETNDVVLGAEEFATILARLTGLNIKADMATSYAAAVEALGAANTEMVIMPPTGYIQAADKYGAEIIYTVVRNGRPYYRGFILYNRPLADKMGLKIRSIFDLKDQKFLFTDPNSTSGYTFPMLLFRSNGINPDMFFERWMFSGGHPQSINSVYLASDPERDFLACATYEDARDSVANQYPDVYEKLQIAAFTTNIPNDPVCIRPNLDRELEPAITKGKTIKKILRDALRDMVNDTEGSRVLLEMSGIEDFVHGRDAWYDIVRTSYYAVKK